MAVQSVEGQRRRRRIFLGTLAGLLLIAGALVATLSRRLPVQEAQRFLTAPVEVGVEPPAAPAAAVPATEIEQHYDAAQAAFKDGRYHDAATDFAWVVAHDPSGAQAGPAQWNLTRSRLRSGDGNGALDALDGLLRHYAGYLGEESPDLRQGLEAMQRNDLPAALASLERMVGDDPDSEFVPLAYALIARIHWTHGEPVEMVRAFARMFASVKDTVPAYRTLAHQLERYASGDATVTKSFADLAQNGDEGFRHIYQYLAARTLLEQDQFDATHTALEELRRRHPDGDFTHIVDLEQAWNLLRHGQAAEALVIFQRLQQQPPPARAEAFDAFFDLRSEIPMGIARCHFALGQYAEAVRLFEQAIATQPHGIYDVENRLSLALSYEGLNQFARAAEVLRDVIAAHPDEPNLWALRQQLARIEDHGKVRQ